MKIENADALAYYLKCRQARNLTERISYTMCSNCLLGGPENRFSNRQKHKSISHYTYNMSSLLEGRASYQIFMFSIRICVSISLWVSAWHDIIDIYESMQRYLLKINSTKSNRNCLFDCLDEHNHTHRMSHETDYSEIHRFHFTMHCFHRFVAFSLSLCLLFLARLNINNLFI